MQGWRNNQEDAEILQVPLEEENSGLFAVFDGHGSDLVSNFSEAYLAQVLKKNANYRNGNYEKALEEVFMEMDEVMLTKAGRRVLFRNILRKEQGLAYEFPANVDFYADVTLNKEDLVDLAIMVEDKVLEKYQKLPEYFSAKEIVDENPQFKCSHIDDILKLSISFCGGCTANVGLLKNGKFYCANAGDSRGVAKLKDGSTFALSYDHKPDNREEKARIESAGGFVSDNRVNANLNLSRAFGDFTYKLDQKYSVKHQLVIAYPEVRSVEIANCKFIILACDGIYDCVSNEELTKWFTVALEEFKNGTFTYIPRKNKEKGKEKISEPVKEIKLEHLVQKFLDEICSVDTMTSCGTDNMTCLLILLN